MSEVFFFFLFFFFCFLSSQWGSNPVGDLEMRLDPWKDFVTQGSKQEITKVSR